MAASTFTSCGSGEDGGSLYARGSAAVDACSFTNSTSAGNGAAIALDPTVATPLSQYLVNVSRSSFVFGTSSQVRRLLLGNAEQRPDKPAALRFASAL